MKQVDDPAVSQLSQQLDEMRAAWCRAVACYNDEDPDVEQLDDPEYWIELIQLCRFYQSTTDETFAAAYDRMARRVESLLCDTFATWAVRVVELTGDERLSLIPERISIPERRRDVHNAIDFAKLFAGTSDETEAGIRLIGWAAKYRKCLVDPLQASELEQRFPEWGRSFIQFGQGELRLAGEPLLWVAKALVTLLKRPAGRRRKDPDRHAKRPARQAALAGAGRESDKSNTQTYTLAEIAHRWSCSHSTVLGLVRSRSLPAIDISTTPSGRAHYIVRHDDLLSFEAAREARGTAPAEPPARRRRVSRKPSQIIEFIR